MKRQLLILLTALPALAVVDSTMGQVSIHGGVQIQVPTPSVQVQIPAPSVQVSTPGFGMQINAVGDFYGPLSSYGTWMDFGSYGRCWHPTQVAADWQPYTDGSWEYTDAGWYWNSQEPWGWATCHYGSWQMDPSIGWVWIPGTEWAPAWVTWRTSDDYVGWAPCGPNQAVLAPSLFVFVGVHNFGGPLTPGVFIRNNRTIINNTTVIRGFNRQTINVDGREKTIFANRGPNVQNIQRATGRTFERRPVADAVRQSKSRAPENLRGNENRREATPPPTGREQQRNYNNEEQNRLNQEQRNNVQKQNQLNQQRERNNLENQNRINQQQRQEQQRAMPSTGREQQRNYNSEQQNRVNQEQQRQQHVAPQETPRTAPSERNLPATGREVNPPSQHQQEIRPSQTPTERQAPTERAQPEQRATPPERNVAPTGHENAQEHQKKDNNQQ